MKKKEKLKPNTSIYRATKLNKLLSQTAISPILNPSPQEIPNCTPGATLVVHAIEWTGAFTSCSDVNVFYRHYEAGTYLGVVGECIDL